MPIMQTYLKNIKYQAWVEQEDPYLLFPCLELEFRSGRGLSTKGEEPLVVGIVSITMGAVHFGPANLPLEIKLHLLHHVVVSWLSLC
jgi:hypothetical protein